MHACKYVIHQARVHLILMSVQSVIEMASRKRKSGEARAVVAGPQLCLVRWIVDDQIGLG